MFADMFIILSCMLFLNAPFSYMLTFSSTLDQILQEFSKELEKLKTLFGRNNSEIGNQLARRSKNNKDDSNLTSQRWIKNTEEKVCHHDNILPIFVQHKCVSVFLLF